MKVELSRTNVITNIYKNNKINQNNKTQRRTDTIEISEMGKYLSKINENKETINVEKINEIKEKIKNNTYKVDSTDLARKILASMKGEK